MNSIGFGHSRKNIYANHVEKGESFSTFGLKYRAMKLLCLIVQA